MKINRTRERILDKSIELFNRKQASNVSTVQISTALETSPGKKRSGTVSEEVPGALCQVPFLLYRENDDVL